MNASMTTPAPSPWIILAGLAARERERNPREYAGPSIERRRRVDREESIIGSAAGLCADLGEPGRRASSREPASRLLSRMRMAAAKASFDCKTVLAPED